MRAFTPQQEAMLRSGALNANALATFYLDEGTYRFSDDIVSLSDGTNTYIGANALIDGIDVNSSESLSAEPTKLVIDGNRMAQFGVEDPAGVLRSMMEFLHQQRRVDLALGIRSIESRELNIIIPIYGGKINNFRHIDSDANEEGVSFTIDSKLEIELDSLALRYGRATHRTRSNADQLEIDPTDRFFSFVPTAVTNEKKLMWGKKAETGVRVGTGGGGGGGFRHTGPQMNLR